MTYYCSPCDVRWSPYRAPGGVCPMCGGGTTRSQDEPTDGQRLRVKDAQAPESCPSSADALLRIWERA